MKCGSCAKETAPSETFFCYWCGEPVCSGCVSRILLPLDTEATVCPNCKHITGRNEAADESMMEIMVNAALAGHDLAEWSLVEDGRGWQARCRVCGETVWVGMTGVQYSLLSDRCLGME
jgi:hypothetical protein